MSTPTQPAEDSKSIDLGCYVAVPPLKDWLKTADVIPRDGESVLGWVTGECDSQFMAQVTCYGTNFQWELRMGNVGVSCSHWLPIRVASYNEKAFIETT